MQVHGRERGMAIGLCITGNICRSSCKHSVVLGYGRGSLGSMRLLIELWWNARRHSPDGNRTSHIVIGVWLMGCKFRCRVETTEKEEEGAMIYTAGDGEFERAKLHGSQSLPILPPVCGI
jgi:hypothetical protein